MSLLRHYNINGKAIEEKDAKYIIFGEFSWPKTVKTNFRIYGYVPASVELKSVDEISESVPKKAWPQTQVYRRLERGALLSGQHFRPIKVSINLISAFKAFAGLDTSASFLCKKNLDKFI